MEKIQNLNAPLYITNMKMAPLRNVNILSKVISLKCSWMKLLYNSSLHPWKVILSYLIDTYLGKNFKFHSNLGIPNNKIKRFLIPINEHLRDGVKIYTHFLIFPWLLLVKFLVIINASKKTTKAYMILKCHEKI